MSQANVDLVKFVYEAFGRGDVSSVLSAMSPGIRWIPADHSPTDRGRAYNGPQEVADIVFKTIGEQWEGFKVKPERFFDAGDTVIMEGRYGGTYRATGRATNAQVIHIWLIRDGKIAEFRQYTDTAELSSVTR
jgi:ketosteroid isomerase-like protein